MVCPPRGGGSGTGHEGEGDPEEAAGGQRLAYIMYFSLSMKKGIQLQENTCFDAVFL